MNLLLPSACLLKNFAAYPLERLILTNVRNTTILHLYKPFDCSRSYCYRLLKARTNVLVKY